MLGCQRLGCFQLDDQAAFNQMLRMQQRAAGQPLYLWDITPESLAGQPILTANHCLGCTAGHGSSCSGALEREGRDRLDPLPKQIPAEDFRFALRSSSLPLQEHGKP